MEIRESRTSTECSRERKAERTIQNSETAEMKEYQTSSSSEEQERRTVEEMHQRNHQKKKKKRQKSLTSQWKHQLLRRLKRQ